MIPQFKDVPFPLAASSEMLFRSLPIVDRVNQLKDLGFLVEIWDWTKHDIKALAATGARFSSMTGYVTGTLADDAGAEAIPPGQAAVAADQQFHRGQCRPSARR